MPDDVKGILLDQNVPQVISEWLKGLLPLLGKKRLFLSYPERSKSPEQKFYPIAIKTESIRPET